MPPRIARSNVQSAAPKTARNKNRKRNLDAFSIASHSAPEKSRIKRSRLGEFLDDRPTPKRRRDEDYGEESDEEEDAPPKRRRAAPKDEDKEGGSDSSGNEWTLGGLKEDDSDSELDSDEAFGESDEERFEGFTFRGSKSGNGKKPSKTSKTRFRGGEDDNEGIDLNEEGSMGEDEEDEEFGEEGVDLATMLDDEDDEILGGKDTTGRDMGEESVSEDDEDGESDVDADSESSDSEVDEEERVARMRDRIDALDGSAQPTKTATTPSQPAALTVEDLLADLDPAQRKQYASALKTRKRSERPKTLTAPLPKRQQARLNRAEASKKAKEQLDRWRDTVIHNRRAEFLSFPLNDPSKGERMGKDRFVVGDEQVPANELEVNIRKIMEESGLATKPGQKPENEEDLLLKAEELATNNLPVEEVMQRRAALRKARELLFREEIKAKRIKKIKSKAYRRVHRRERLRLEKEDDALRELNGEADMDEDEEEKFERKRAEARMSTKHKDSKFAKSLNQTNRTVWDDGAREAVIDEARRREELKRRIRGEEINDDGIDDSEVPSGNEDDSADEDEDAATQWQLNRVTRNEIDNDGNPIRGLRAMKFMRAADARQRAQNDEDVERLRKELAIEDGNEEMDEEVMDDQGLGRAIFGPKGRAERVDGEGRTKAKKPEMEEGDLTDAEDDGEPEPDIITDKVASEPNSKQKKTDRPIATLGNVFREDQQRMIAEEQQSLKGNWFTAAVPKKDKKRKAFDESKTLVNLGLKLDSAKAVNPCKTTNSTNQEKQKEIPQTDSQPGSTGGWTLVPYNNQDNDEEAGDEAEPSDPILPEAQRQAELKKAAFAVDDAIASTFAAEKASAADSEDEKEISAHLPGWGSWAGPGLTKSDKRANAYKKHNPLHKTKIAGVKKEDRKDAKLENVIISEKQNRKGKHYMAPILPHGFETKAQYERSLRLPMGPEWSTKEVFQRATRPRVVVKPGTVVEAMERPLV